MLSLAERNGTMSTADDTARIEATPDDGVITYLPDEDASKLSEEILKVAFGHDGYENL